MVEDRLSKSLTEMGFKRIDSSSPGLYFHYRLVPGEVQIISVMHIHTGRELGITQYQAILGQIKDNFIQQGMSNVRLLNLIFTYSPYDVRQFCLEEDEHWIVNMNTRQLILYENQSSDFIGLKAMIETVLEEEAFEKKKIPSKDLWFSPVNMVIIGINILVFIVMNIAGIFGNYDRITDAGAISWYYVLKEGQYYRVLTSMFIHANISHIFNNMLVLLFVGVNLERAAGKIKYIFIYFGAGILAAATSIGYNMWKDDKTLAIGASGAIFGVVGAMLYVIIINKGRLENISARQMIIFAVLSLYGGFVNVGIDNSAHIGGFISGFLLAVILYRRPNRKINTMKDEALE